MVKYTLEVVRAEARRKGGDCLEIIEGKVRKARLTCEKGHEWLCHLSKVFSRWCPHCWGRYKYNINVMKDIARERGGDCLSTVYKNVMIPLKWICEFGHEFNACPHNIITNNQWCPECNLSKPPTQDEVDAHAVSKGGKCLSPYVNSRSKIHWECMRGHD